MRQQYAWHTGRSVIAVAPRAFVVGLAAAVIGGLILSAALPAAHASTAGHREDRCALCQALFTGAVLLAAVVAVAVGRDLPQHLVPFRSVLVRRGFSHAPLPRGPPSP
jgi:hypothetical protein